MLFVEENALLNALNKIEHRLNQIDDKLNKIDQRFVEIDHRFNQIDDRLYTLTASVMGIEQKIGFYGDMYDLNKFNIGRLNSRLLTVEDSLGINPPEELLIPTNPR